MRDRNPLVIVAVCGLALFALASCSSGPSKGSEVGNPTEDDIAAPLLQTVRLTDRLELRYSDRFVFAGSSGSYELAEASDGSRAAAIAVMPAGAAGLFTIGSCPVSARFTSWDGFAGCWVEDDLYATDGVDVVIFEFHKTVDLASELTLVSVGAGSGGASAGGQNSGAPSGAKGLNFDVGDFWSKFFGDHAPQTPDMEIITETPEEPPLFVIGEEAEEGDASVSLPIGIIIAPGSSGSPLPPSTIDVDVVKVLKNIHDGLGQP